MDYWQKQTDKPLFEELIWSRPENKRYAGKLLVVGGHAGEFSHVAAAYQAAEKAGTGHIRVLLPQSLERLASMMPEVEFAPANKSGSFAKNALASWFDASEWADHVLFAGDFGKNSETTTIIDDFLLRGAKPTTLNLNSLSSIAINLEQLIKMQVTLVIDRTMLQKIGTAIGLTVPIKSTTPMEQLAGIIHQVSQGNRSNLVIKDEEVIWTAAGGNVVSTKSKQIDNTKLSAACAVWLMQNSNKPLKALATACYKF